MQGILKELKIMLIDLNPIVYMGYGISFRTPKKRKLELIGGPFNFNKKDNISIGIKVIDIFGIEMIEHLSLKDDII
ncbi:MAG: hypothetical protein ACFE9M_07365 [Promethearchaeota archaeon]